jgi:hypothetical protein
MSPEEMIAFLTNESNYNSMISVLSNDIGEYAKYVIDMIYLSALSKMQKTSSNKDYDFTNSKFNFIKDTIQKILTNKEINLSESEKELLRKIGDLQPFRYPFMSSCSSSFSSSFSSSDTFSLDNVLEDMVEKFLGLF